MKEQFRGIFIPSIIVAILIFTSTNLIINAENIDNTLLKKEDYISEKTQLSFAAFTDTHIGVRHQNPYWRSADYLNLIGKDLVDSTNKLDFAINLGDIIHRTTGHVNGEELPWHVNQYYNNMKAYYVSNINLPFHVTLGNHDINDYYLNEDNPHNLTKSIVDELSMNNPVYAMMRDGILFLFLSEVSYVQWTHPVQYEWIEYMTKTYPDSTTIILTHNAIEDTTIKDNWDPYRAKQDMEWWDNLFRNNPQIKMWMHGHNHMKDWYVGDKSTGLLHPVRDFGHEILFSTPYPQMEWSPRDEEDRIVIYNISSTGVETGTWENNGKGGKWISGYIHSWQVPTTFNPNAEDWYAFPMFLQDNETQITDMKILSPDITLQLIGTVPMELFYDSRMEAPSGKPHAPEVIVSFGNDRNGNVVWQDPGMKVEGPCGITFPPKKPYHDAMQEDGRSGQPYHSFPMGTICAAVPGQTYNFTMTAKSTLGEGRFELNVSCTDWGTKSQFSVLTNSESQVLSHTFESNSETIHGIYTVPDDIDAWFLQGNLSFLDSTYYEISLFSVKRERCSDLTEDFHLCLSGNWFNSTGPIEEDKAVNFSINPQVLCNNDGVINFTTQINGNRYGMVNLVYHEPILLSRNARFKVNSYTDDVFNLTLTKTISRNSPVKSIIWNSELFKKHPIATELIFRLLFHGRIGKLLEYIFKDATAEFKMLPFSTDSMYNKINISADDCSGIKHIGENGNIWLTCNCPLDNEIRYVEVILPSK